MKMQDVEVGQTYRTGYWLFAKHGKCLSKGDDGAVFREVGCILPGEAYTERAEAIHEKVDDLSLTRLLIFIFVITMTILVCGAGVVLGVVFL